MAEDRFYTISEAARLLGKPKNRKRVRALIKFGGIRTWKTGSGTLINDEGLELLKKADEEWESRPSINGLARATA